MRMLTVFFGMVAVLSFLGMCVTTQSHRDAVTMQMTYSQMSDSSLAHTIRAAGPEALTLSNITSLRLSCFTRKILKADSDRVNDRPLVLQIFALLKGNYYGPKGDMDKFRGGIEECENIPFSKEIHHLADLLDPNNNADNDLRNRAYKQPINSLAEEPALLEKGFKFEATFDDLWRHYEQINNCRFSDTFEKTDGIEPC